MTEAIDANAIVYMSDTAVTPELKQALKDGVTPLENIPESRKDWHPGSDGKVLDIVHPSLCPLVYGRSRILSDKRVPLITCHEYSGGGDIIPMPKVESEYYSKNFQWLPCEVQLGDDGNARITSYINNLHATPNAALYAAIEKIITRSVPLWINCLLSTLCLPKEDRMDEIGTGYIHDDVDYDDIEDESYFKVPEPKQFGSRIRVRRSHPLASPSRDSDNTSTRDRPPNLKSKLCISVSKCKRRECKSL